MDILIYSKDGCPFCDMLKRWANQNKLEYKEIKLNDNEERKKFYESCGNGVSTVPQMFVNGIRYGDYNDVMARSKEILEMKDKKRLSIKSIDF